MPYRVICVVVHGILYYHKTQGYIYILGDKVIQTISRIKYTNLFLEYFICDILNGYDITFDTSFLSKIEAAIK